MNTTIIQYLKRLSAADLLFMILVGTYLGVVGNAAERPLVSIVVSALLTTLFAIYTLVLSNNEGIWSGVIAGLMIGTILALASLIIGGRILTIQNGILFGLTRGALFGAVAGVITRAKPEPSDTSFTKLFLYVGSIFLGAVLGIVVGVASGTLLGLIQSSRWGIVIAAILGAIVGTYLATLISYRLKYIWGALFGGSFAFIVQIIGGPIAGIFLGIITGALTPMLLVALIGAFGGLTSRGLIAMVVEAVEAPSEMITQGAVPFLAPAMLVGLIIGTTAIGIGSLIVLPTGLAIIGLLLGALSSLDGKRKKRITSRYIIELVILGSDDWPLAKIAKQTISKEHHKLIIFGIIIGIFTGIIGNIIGSNLVGFILNLIESIPA
ncbi:MAG: hypothetical protein GY943_15205 [Chloroflexi bacterium]|nr:hypothetical protein [Chloroflexota bacterium]